jgi:uncharacterized protein DUF4352
MKRVTLSCVLIVDGVQMLPVKKLLSILLFAIFLLTACSTASETFPTPLYTPPIPLPQPAATGTGPLPTPSAPGDSILWDQLQVTMTQPEITQEYLSEYGSTRLPPPGQKFLWVYVQLKNSGSIQKDVPLAEHFSVLYAATELKPTYGHRMDYSDYTALGSTIFPNQTLDGWLRFDIPLAADLKDLRFVFLPESSHVGASFSEPNYPYGNDKPTFVWNCGP